MSASGRHRRGAQTGNDPLIEDLDVRGEQHEIAAQSLARHPMPRQRRREPAQALVAEEAGHATQGFLPARSRSAEQLFDLHLARRRCERRHDGAQQMTKAVLDAPLHAPSLA